MAYAVWHGLAADESNSDIVVLASPDVTVTDRSDGSKASLFADRGGSTSLGNPFTANADGSITFYVAPGRYKIEATKDGNTVTWDNVLIGAPHGLDSRTDRAVPMYDAANNQFVPATDLVAPVAITESATDDAYTANFGRDVADTETVVGDVGTANTTTTPSLENTGGTPGALTITTKDGSALWAGALEGVHTFQRNASTSWLVLDPNRDTTGVDPALVSGTAGTSGNIAEWNADGDAVDSGVATSDTLRKPGTSTDPALAFNTWRTPNSNRPTLVVAEIQAETDGTSPGIVILSVDESGGTTQDYRLSVIADKDAGAGVGIRSTPATIIPAGGSYQFDNNSDPNAANSVPSHREFTL